MATRVATQNAATAWSTAAMSRAPSPLRLARWAVFFPPPRRRCWVFRSVSAARATFIGMVGHIRPTLARRYNSCIPQRLTDDQKKGALARRVITFAGASTVDNQAFMDNVQHIA